MRIITGLAGRTQSREHEPDPTAVALGQMLSKDAAFNKHMEEITEAQDRVERTREENGPRRVS